MATIFILWTQEQSNYRSTEPTLLQAFGDEAEAHAAKGLIEKCQPKNPVMISQVEFIGKAKPEKVYRGALGQIPSVFFSPRNVLLNDPPAPERAPDLAGGVADMAEKIHDEAEA